MVRIVLHEKGLPWESKILDLLRGDQFQPEYRKLNPKAVVPTLVHDAHTITESRLIIEYLDEVFPSHPLMPTDPYRRAIAQLWMKKIDDYLHDAVAVLSFAIAFRRKLLKRTPEQIEARFAAIPDPTMRKHQRKAAHEGIEALLSSWRYLFAGRFRGHSLHQSRGNAGHGLPLAQQQTLRDKLVRAGPPTAKF
jgi:glutathione S-transferase